MSKEDYGYIGPGEAANAFINFLGSRNVDFIKILRDDRKRGTYRITVGNGDKVMQYYIDGPPYVDYDRTITIIGDMLEKCVYELEAAKIRVCNVTPKTAAEGAFPEQAFRKSQGEDGESIGI